jgi:hypothetical protein
MLTWIKSRDTHRGLMSCGHAIDPNNLFNYMYYCVLKGLYEIKCPYIDPVDPNNRCSQIWSYQELRKMALLNSDEKDFFEIQMSENKIRAVEDISECKKCHYHIKRHPTTTRIICQSCLIDDIQPDIFCFVCKQPWQRRRKIQCSNSDCGKSIAMKLKGVAKKIICGESVKSIQACPKCDTLLEHIGTEYCRTMRCPCGYKFCFVCGKGDMEFNFLSCKVLAGGCGEFESKSTNMGGLQ